MLKTIKGGNEATKKSRKNLLKHQFETFTALSYENIEGTYERLHKLTSQMALLKIDVSQEDINLKFLRSLSSEWNTHTVIWRHKEYFEKMTLDDLYNNLKVYESEVKGLSSSSSTTNNLAFVSSSNKNSGSHQEQHSAAGTFVPAVGSHVSAADSTNTNTISDAAICAYLAELTTSTSVMPQDLDELDPDDVEEIDMQWQFAMLTMRARRFLKRTGKEMKFRRNKNVGFDKSKAECFNCHKKGHFARECKAPKRNIADTKKIAVEESSPDAAAAAMVSCDGLGEYD